MCITFFYLSDGDACAADTTIDDANDTNDTSSSTIHAPGYQLILAMNRDEQYARPTKPAERWGANPACVSGRDMEAGREGGTWLGASENGKVGMLLNILLNKMPDPDKKGRGHLVTDYLQSNTTALEYIQQIAPEGHLYNYFNLVLIEYSSTQHRWIPYYYTNVYDQKGDYALPTNEPVYGCSNSTMDVPFAKVKAGRSQFTEVIAQYGDGSDEDALVDALMHIMSDTTQHLPDTQLDAQSFFLRLFGDAFMKQRSGVFVDSRQVGYGTRTTTVLLVSSDGKRCRYIEKDMHKPPKGTNIISPNAQAAMLQAAMKKAATTPPNVETAATIPPNTETKDTANTSNTSTDATCTVGCDTTADTSKDTGNDTIGDGAKTDADCGVWKVREIEFALKCNAGVAATSAKVSDV